MDDAQHVVGGMAVFGGITNPLGQVYLLGFIREPLLCQILGVLKMRLELSYSLRVAG